MYIDVEHMVIFLSLKGLFRVTARSIEYVSNLDPGI